MKKTLLAFTYIFLCAIFVNAQNETMYIMKDDSVVGQHLTSEIDSVIFYKPSTDPVAVSSINFTSSEVSIYINETIDLSEYLSIGPANATDKSVTWELSGSTSASVNSNGVVTAGSSAESFTATATTNDGSNLSDSITVTVNAEAPNAYYQGNIPNAKYIGRWQKDGDYDRSGYNGAMVKVNFTGKNASINHNGAVEFFVKIDDGPWQFHQKTYGTGLINLTPTPLNEGEHTLVMVAGAPNTYSPDKKMVFGALELDPNAETRIPNISNKHIEFIGDSISTICYEDDTPDEHWNWIIGDNLGWEHSHIALPSNTTNDLLNKYPTFYNGSGTWDFSLYTPDAIVVNLGQNGGVPSDSPTNVYRQAVASYREKWPNAPIICLGLFWSASASSARNIEEVVTNMIAEGDNNLYFLSDAEGMAGLHPANEENDNIAAALTPKIKEILGLN